MNKRIKGQITHFFSNSLYGVIQVVDEFYNDVYHTSDSYIFFVPDFDCNKIERGLIVEFDTFETEVGTRARNLTLFKNQNINNTVKTIKCPF